MVTQIAGCFVYNGKSQSINGWEVDVPLNIKAHFQNVHISAVEIPRLSDVENWVKTQSGIYGEK